MSIVKHRLLLLIIPAWGFVSIKLIHGNNRSRYRLFVAGDEKETLPCFTYGVATLRDVFLINPYTSPMNLPIDV